MTGLVAGVIEAVPGVDVDPFAALDGVETGAAFGVAAFVGAGELGGLGPDAAGGLGPDAAACIGVRVLGGRGPVVGFTESKLGVAGVRVCML